MSKKLIIFNLLSNYDTFSASFDHFWSPVIVFEMRFHISGRKYIILIIFDKLQHLINNLGHVTLSALNQQSAIWWSDCYKKMPNIICDFHLAEALKAVNHHSCDSKLLSGNRPNEGWRWLMSLSSGVTLSPVGYFTFSMGLTLLLTTFTDQI